MTRLRMAVVGCGHLGRIHARLLKTLDNVHVAAVVDPLAEARQQVAAEHAASALTDYQDLPGRVDAAIIATPTSHHYDVAVRLLSAGIHVLVEKPITHTVAQADHLITLAADRQLVLQVGHVERFNPAWNAVVSHLERPQYIEAVRAGTYSFRATDVSIVLDLMIHDLDLVLSVARSPVVDVEAMGLALFGPHADLALARLKFANGCVALLKASRVHGQPQRSMLVFSQQACASVDFTTGSAELIRPTAAVLRGEVDLTRCPTEQRSAVQESLFRDLLPRETVQVEPTNAILEEQRQFVASVLHGDPVRVTGQQGRDALAVAHQILAAIEHHRWNTGGPHAAIGPHATFHVAHPATRQAA